MSDETDMAYMIKFPLGRLLYRSGHTIRSLKNDLHTSHLKVCEALENPDRMKLEWVKKISEISNQPLQTIINVCTGLTPDDKHYLDEDMTSIIEDDKAMRAKWGNRYKEKLNEIKKEKTKRLMPSWASEEVKVVEKTSNIIEEHTTRIQKNDNRKETKEMIEARRDFAHKNPENRTCVKFNLWCEKCKSPEYFTLERCFDCKFFENDMSKPDLRKIKPPKGSFFIHDQKKRNK